MNAQTNRNINIFFEKEIAPKDFAKSMRKLMHATITLHLQNEEGVFKEWIEDGYFNLTQFLEKIDPQLED